MGSWVGEFKNFATKSEILSVKTEHFKEKEQF